MEKPIVAGSFGTNGSYTLEFKAGHLILTVSYKLGPFNAGLAFNIDSDNVIDAITKAIPGQIDDAFAQLLKNALKSL